MSARQLELLLERGIESRVFPGACFAIGRQGAQFVGCAGRHTYDPNSTAVNASTLWDLASITKVAATTSIAMLLFDEGRLDLGQPVAETLPDFGARGKHMVTPLNLLLHDAGLAAFHNYGEMGFTSGEAVIQSIYNEELEAPVGARTEYSDLGMITFGKLLESLGGGSLDGMFQERIAGPLGMKDTFFNPSTEERARCAPTEPVEPWRRDLRRMRYGTNDFANAQWIQGDVHDPTACVLGGVAGHAGLFSTAGDMALFAQMILDRGEAEGSQLLQPATLLSWTRRQNAQSSRGLGWDTRTEESSCGPRFSGQTFGHTGFTGTSIWIDPEQQMFSILLTNRVHPTAENQKLGDFRVLFNTAAAEFLLN